MILFHCRNRIGEVELLIRSQRLKYITTIQLFDFNFIHCMYYKTRQETMIFTDEFDPKNGIIGHFGPVII